MKQILQLVKKCDIACGMSTNGEWERQTLVFQSLDDEPRYIPIEVFGKRKVRGMEPLQCGSLVEVTFRIDGREHEGRWFARLELIAARPMVMAVPEAAPTVDGASEVETSTNELDNIF